jgi:hypothetical protein
MRSGWSSGENVFASAILAPRPPFDPTTASHQECHPAEHFKLSPDPQFIDKVRDIVGLYLNPPEAAVVLCVDEKSQIQALDGTAPVLPLMPACLSGAPTTTAATAQPTPKRRSMSPPAR